MGVIENAIDRFCQAVYKINHQSRFSEIHADVNAEDDFLEKLLIIDQEILALRLELTSLRKMLKSTRKFHDSVHVIVSSTESGAKMYKAINYIENIIDTISDELVVLTELFEAVRDGKLVAIKTEGFFFKHRVAYLVETT